MSKTRLESQFWRKYCQTFSAGLGSGDLVGEGHERDVLGDVELGGGVPAGLIEPHDGMRARRDGTADFLEMQVHGLGVGARA